MIASVVAVLDPQHPQEEVLAAIAALPYIEIGNVSSDLRRVPLVIDTTSPLELETATEQLRRCPGVAFVHVVFVHLEDSGTTPRDTLAAERNEA